MYFTVERKGERKVVKLPKSASCGEVARAAFGCYDSRDIKVVIATKSLDIANAALCQVWPVDYESEHREDMGFSDNPEAWPAGLAR